MHGLTRLVLGSLTATMMSFGLACFVPAAVASPTAGSSPSAPFTVNVAGIDRDGTPVSVKAWVYGTDGTSYLSGSGNSVSVPPGTYEVAARIWQASDGPDQTLVAKTVTVTGNTNVTLDARGSVPVHASISATGVTRDEQIVQLCINTGSYYDAMAGFQVGPTGTAYVKPISASPLRMVYLTSWNAGRTRYDLARSYTGGIPSHPTYRDIVSNMARVQMRMRWNESVTPLVAIVSTFAGCGSLEPPVHALPYRYTDYRTAGHWVTDLNFGHLPSPVQRDLATERTYRAGHSYTDVFGSAVAGPGKVFPTIDGSAVTYAPGNLFSDPVVRTPFNCEGKAQTSLIKSGRLLKKQKMVFCTRNVVFSKHLARSGWVTLKSVATRYNPSGSLPEGQLLSRRVSMTWRFKFAPVTGHRINAQAAPVTVTKFVPQRVNMGNDVWPRTWTPVKVVILRGGGQPVPTRRYRLRTVRVLASFNDGHTWHRLRVTRHGSHWLVRVHDPVPGFVSLRSIVTDVHGDKTTETIRRAYLSSLGA